MLKVFTFMCATLAVVVSLKNYNYNEYRNLYTCKGLPHIFFVYQTEKPAPSCYNVFQIGFKNEDKKKLLRLHNNWRQNIAMGEGENPKTKKLLPPARVMQNLTWDEELEDLAQRWLNQCTLRLPDKEFCYDSERFPVGQWGVRCFPCSGPALDMEKWVDDIWDNAMRVVNSTVVQNYTYSIAEDVKIPIGHVLWADSKYVGCGYIEYTKPKVEDERVTHQTIFEMACNYGPRGAIIGKPIYSTF